MTQESNDEHDPANDAKDTRSPQQRRGKHAKTVARLEQALAGETRTSTMLRDSLEKLQEKVAEIEASFAQRLDEAGKCSERAEAKLLDQQARLNALGAGREDTMHVLNETRAELARVTADRNQLQKKLTLIDGMQTETITLSEDSYDQGEIRQPLPTMEELMASLSSIQEVDLGGRDSPSNSASSGHADEPQEEMIPADLIFTEEDESDHPRAAAERRSTRVLVYLDAHPPIKYPLYKDVITIGRSTSADIQIEDDFISRVHARIVSDEYRTIVEDVDSKNGIKVNSKLVGRHALQHGDVIGLGKLRFTFIETTAERAD